MTDPPVPPPPDGGPPAASGGGVPLPLVAAAVLIGAALGCAVGMRVGKSIGSARLGEPVPVRPVYVERCAECAKHAEGNGQVAPEQVEAILADQQAVENATE